jgi:hypothetical protein
MKILSPSEAPADQAPAEEAPSEEAKPEEKKEEDKAAEQLVDVLQKENTELKEQLAAYKKNETVASILKESKLSEKAVTEVFMKQLRDAKDEDTIRSLIEDRKAIGLVGEKPTSRDGWNITEQSTARTYDGFLKAVK